ncbi:MAG: molybdopterin molybdotransferase MoeA [Bacteroidetes bacterium]|nr:molybdopterin molybdotransferase MoeA [Fibrella sp.]
MLSVADAFAITQTNLLDLGTEVVPLDAALGRVLREAIHADRDFPPFDRVAMDGIAIHYQSFADGQRRFRVAGMQRAGQPQQSLANTDTCLEAMTGAMLPLGTDAVIRYEDLTVADGMATINIDDVRAGQHIHHRATDRQAGDELIHPGARLQPNHIAVAASVGKSTLTVSVLPRIAVVSTGDELVDVHEQPLAYQIRRSNTYMLRAALATMGLAATLHHLPDDEPVLEAGLSDLLKTNDIVILNGGVSAGKADFVPATLTRLGVERLFHKVEQRPGKPLWFGAIRGQKTVFALPGNPVSTAICFYRYLKPYLQATLGQTPEPARYVRLTTPVTFQPPVTYFTAVSLETDADGSWLATPLPSSGSADFANLLTADGFAELPAEESQFDAGTTVRIWGV